MGQAQIPLVDLQQFTDRVGVGTALGFLPGQIFYVHGSNGSANNDGLTARSPLTTLALALAKCSSNQADTVVLMAGHTETLSATTQGVLLSKSGVNILGQGAGRSRPALTCGAANIVGVSVTGSSNLMKNVRIIGSSSQTSATSYATYVTGTDNVFEDCVWEHGAGPLRAVGMAGASRSRFINPTFIGTAAGPDVSIFVETASNNSVFRNVLAQYIGSSGLDSGVIKGSTGVAVSDWLIDGLVGIGCDATVVDINGSGAIATSDGVATNVIGSFSAGITLANGFDTGGLLAVNSILNDNNTLAGVVIGANYGALTAAQRIPAGSPCT